jgi:serine protease Do
VGIIWEVAMLQADHAAADGMGLACPPTAIRRCVGGMVWLLLAVSLAVPTHALASANVLQYHDELEAAMILRIKPAVVGIITEVGAEVTIRCGAGGVYVVRPEATRENGTGFIIHPDGWIATNGHVVAPAYTDDEDHAADFLEAAADAACKPALARLPEHERKARLQRILRDPENRKGVRLSKKLEVYLPAVPSPEGKPREGIPAVVKAYSPPIDPDLLPKGGAKPDPPMLDAAIIKIERRDLPAVRLAPPGRSVSLGQQIFIVGYPGVVMWHDFLSRTTRSEATVTFGRVSSFKDDINERRIIQTDAPISWGNSGGPAFSQRDEVIGLATFISTSLDGDQAIQGFNFLIPVETIHDMARRIGLTPTAESPFMEEWRLVGWAYFEGRYGEALRHLEAADKIVPGLADVERVRGRVQKLLEEHASGAALNRSLMAVSLFGMAVVIAAVLLGVRVKQKRRRIPSRPA